MVCSEKLPGGINLAVKNAARPDFLRDFYVYRGDYRYQRQHVFFNQDLIDEYGKAHFARALELVVDPSGVSDAHRSGAFAYVQHGKCPCILPPRVHIFSRTGWTG